MSLSSASASCARYNSATPSTMSATDGASLFLLPTLLALHCMRAARRCRSSTSSPRVSWPQGWAASPLASHNDVSPIEAALPVPLPTAAHQRLVTARVASRTASVFSVQSCELSRSSMTSAITPQSPCRTALSMNVSIGTAGMAAATSALDGLGMKAGCQLAVALAAGERAKATRCPQKCRLPTRSTARCTRDVKPPFRTP
mmetsp:Transcript_45572/g.97034  ORF Transcript_45572/g.97034 Transcript_45572/m.97034 type:complete len:201 (+) Transcript_45572:170-772(+)